MKVSVDRGRCCGAGLCTLRVPEVFDQDDTEGLVLLLDAEPAPGLHGRVAAAADACPSGAIGVYG